MNYTTNINTQSKRDMLKSRMDDFTSFSWRGQDAFNTFGAFVVGGKDALKFYNGPSFSNKYTKPQFESANSLLTGVEFQTQKVDFTIGVYWFTIEEYRKFLHWLHPYEVNDLCFSYAPGWRYRAKVAKIGDSTRHILGRDHNGEYRYYTEIKISFEIQGAACLYSTTPYQWTWEAKSSYLTEGKFNLSDRTFKSSDLNTPLDISFAILPTSCVEDDLYPQEAGLTTSDGILAGGAILNWGKTYHITLSAILPLPNDGQNKIVLFDTNLQHLPECVFTSTNDDSSKFYFTDIVTPVYLRYLSESGIVFIQFGDSEEKLLTLQTSSPTGKRLCQTLTVNKFYLPGLLECYGLTDTDFKNIKLEIRCGDYVKLVNYNNQLDISVECYARTNII